MSVTIEEQLRDKAIQVELLDTGLAFIPKRNMDDGIRAVLATEGKGLYEAAIEVRDRLAVLGQEAVSNPTDWKALHKRITAKWPIDTAAHFDAYSHLVGWIGVWLMRTTALNKLKQPLLADVLAGRKADISFTGRVLPQLEQQLVGICILWPDIRKKVLGLSLGRI
jgi:hypothetical protein